MEAYVENNHLHVIGFESTPLGIFPFEVSCEIEGEINDGIIDVENVPLEVGKAFEKVRPVIMKRLNVEKIKAAAGDYVERARQGDQNAMSVLVAVRNAAERGNERATMAKDIIAKYIDTHPIDGTPNIGAENSVIQNSLEKVKGFIKRAFERSPFHYAVTVKESANCLPIDSGYVVRLANGPILLSKKDELNPHVTAIFKTFQTPIEQKAFGFALKTQDKGKVIGLCQRVSSLEQNALKIGYAVGLAKRIQAVRLPTTPIAILSPMAAWELGE